MPQSLFINTWAALAILATGVLSVLCIDLSTPLGVAAWVLYFPLLWYAAQLRHLPTWPIPALAGGITFLMVIGLLFSAEGGLSFEMDLLSRSLGMGTLWAMTWQLLLLRRKENLVGRETLKLQQHADILNLAPILVRDLDDRIVTWNLGAQQLYGYTAQEAVGRLSHELLETSFPKPFAEIKETLVHRRAWQGELMHTTKSGDTLVVKSHWIMHHNGTGSPVAILEVNTDITERIEADRKVKALALLPAQNPAPVLRIGVNGIVLYMNPAAAQLISHLDLRVGQPAPLELQHLVTNSLNAKKAQRMEYALGPSHYLITINPVVHDEYANLYWTDITERKESEEALHQSEEKLRALAGQLEQRVQERTFELVQSQERLRILATELNLAEQRERQRLAIELHDHLQQTLVLGKLKIGQGKRTAQSHPPSLEVLQQMDDLLSEALQYTKSLVADLSPPVLRDHGLVAGFRWLRDYMTKHGLMVTVDVRSERELNLPHNQTLLLFQCVRELLLNAAKHAGTGQATLTIDQHSHRLEIAVRDEGEGFDVESVVTGEETPGESLESLSSKFGLFSIRERMRALGGWLNIQSIRGKGTTATIALPLADDVQRTQQKHAFERRQIVRQSPSQRATTRTRILLVDDHAMVRQGLRTMLEGYADIDVIGEAADGEEAVLAVEQLQPSVVIMDINMPRVNGIEATRQIKQRFPEVRIIGLSVQSDEVTQTAMVRAGAALLLTKEAAVNQLYHAIREHK